MGDTVYGEQLLEATALGAAATKENMAGLVLRMHLGMEGLGLTPQ